MYVHKVRIGSDPDRGKSGPEITGKATTVKSPTADLVSRYT